MYSSTQSLTNVRHHHSQALESSPKQFAFGSGSHSGVAPALPSSGSVAIKRFNRLATALIRFETAWLTKWTACAKTVSRPHARVWVPLSVVTTALHPLTHVCCLRRWSAIVRSHAYSRTPTLTSICTRVYPHMHPCTRVYPQTHPLTAMHPLPRVYRLLRWNAITNAHNHPHAHPHLHTHARTSTHTHSLTHTHAQTHAPKVRRSLAATLLVATIKTTSGEGACVDGQNNSGVQGIDDGLASSGNHIDHVLQLNFDPLLSTMLDETTALVKMGGVPSTSHTRALLADCHRVKVSARSFGACYTACHTVHDSSWRCLHAHAPRHPGTRSHMR